MNVPPPLPFAPVQQKLDHTSVWQLVLGVVSLVLSGIFAIGLVLLSSSSKSSSSSNTINIEQISYLYWIIGLLILFAIPSIVSAARRISGRTSPEIKVEKRQLLIVVIAMLFWGGLLYIGQNSTAWKLPSWLTSPLNILVIAIPILLIITLGLYHLTASSRQRIWAMFGDAAAEAHGNGI
jgi:hypothetical protein